MNVQLLEILNESKVLVKVGENRFYAVWDGDKPEKNKIYTVEMDIDDVLWWGVNIIPTKENVDVIIQKTEYIKIIAKLDYDTENDFASLKVYDSIVLVDLIGLDRKVLNEWVEINCRLVSLSDINL